METQPNQPLAERLRPTTLDKVIGQHKATDLLSQIVASGEPVSLIFWGPPGTGKTTLARIIARQMEADFIELSAVTSGKKDIKRIVEHAQQNWNLGVKTILFVDEIHRFNKAQQDAFLPHVESGLITLIGATTENPSFEVISPLISRSRVIVLEPLDKASLIEIIKTAVKKLKVSKRI
jgi:putative ATPase